MIPMAMRSAMKYCASLAGELRDHIRYPDTIGRYGGEEFLVVLPHSTLKAASATGGTIVQACPVLADQIR